MAEDDRETFTRWASQRQLALLRLAVLVSGDHHRAEDLVQEALTQVALRWRTLRDGHPEAYARQVIVRGNISWWRRRRESPTEYVADRAAPRDADATERAVLVRDALATLTSKQRAVLVLRYFDDLTERESAQILGVSVGTVKSQTAAALARLRACAPELADLHLDTGR